MRVWLSGAGGFVGSNLAEVFAGRHGAELCAPGRGEVDVTDPGAVHRSVRSFAPDAVVHCAILNDMARLSTDRRAAWDAYVGATRNVVDAANAVGAHAVLVSTDWVFDGERPGATEEEPPAPVNPYGFLKAVSELVVTERAERGTVARVAGVLHCCGGEAVDRAGLARRATRAFALDPDLLEFGPPPPGSIPGMRVPRDTSLDATATAAALGVELPDLDAQLAGLREEMEMEAA